MTTFASRSAFPTPTYTTNSTSTMNLPRTATAQQNQTHVFTSPTESEFSDTYRSTTTTSDPSSAAIETWDESKVADWLRSINCAQYIPLFLQNHINGENLLEIDKNMLKEIGIKKLGDRVRINEKARQMRGRVLRRGGRRAINRTSLATLDGNSALTPPSSGSPARPLHSARVTGRAEKRMSRQIALLPGGGGGEGGYAGLLGANKPSSSSSVVGSRPSSPMMVDQENRGRVPRASPMESRGKEQGGAYFATGGGARQQGSAQTRGDTPQTARFAGHLKSSSTDNLNISIVGALPSDKPLIRVIYENGRSSVVNITDFRTAEDIIRATLRKGALNENHFRSFCFYVLDGTDPNPMYCRRLGEGELVKLCSEGVRSERGRLILRKIHTAEPEGEQLRQAARIAEQQRPEPPAIEVFPSGGTGGQKSKSHSKIEQLMGESLGAVSYPMSPASQAERRDYFAQAEQSNKGEGLMRGVSQASSTTTSASARARKLKDFYGARPPTELITQDLTSYFPEVGREEMERTVRMSIRRSKRYSKAFSRLSTVSNFSVASSLKDAPPLPSIADHWASSSAGVGGVGGLGRRQPGLRPFSVVHLGRSDSRGERPESFRESIASSSVLAPLDEEDSPGENRKSYVSFSAESGSETGRGDRERDVMAITDPEGNTVMQSYFDDTQSSPGNTVGAESRSSTEGSLNSRISQFIAEDGEEEDEELMELLQKNSWDDLKYMKGEMIGQGSFGTVYLALHAVTAELMAVKQVEMPSGNNNAMDAKRNNMIEALNHEITLLRDLRHPNIVQYLGSNSDEQHLNIFLEYVAGGSVASMLVNYGSLPEGLIANFVRQILCGLAYLHSEEIIHRDIKGANILVDNKGTVKISDFGISKRVEASTLLTQNSGGVVAPGKRAGGPRVSLQGSVFWMAPEVVRQTAYTKKADIWSLGCLVVEMFTGSHPHPNCTQLQAIFKIGGKGGSGTGDGARPDMPVGASEEAREFMGRTFEIEHERRPTAEELRSFKWLQVGVGKN
ncbi:ATP binding [Elasticomyces elasticus]|uniref:mitogen-activated protein kinase n=1 Tax=Elasticomyces elasticus TaxID=574655 RepID=A0AAN7WAZ1_9PEZI|nr:ATP binding [Elasticomyces elasticus]